MSGVCIFILTWMQCSGENDSLGHATTRRQGPKRRTKPQTGRGNRVARNVGVYATFWPFDLPLERRLLGSGRSIYKNCKQSITEGSVLSQG